MGRLRAIFNGILWKFWSSGQSRPEDIPKKLDVSSLKLALEEARFLKAQSVDVQPLHPGEIPGLPRRADTD